MKNSYLFVIIFIWAITGCSSNEGNELPTDMMGYFLQVPMQPLQEVDSVVRKLNLGTTFVIDESQGKFDGELDVDDHNYGISIQKLDDGFHVATVCTVYYGGDCYGDSFVEVFEYAGGKWVSLTEAIPTINELEFYDHGTVTNWISFVHSIRSDSLLLEVSLSGRGDDNCFLGGRFAYYDENGEVLDEDYLQTMNLIWGRAYSKVVYAWDAVNKKFVIHHKTPNVDKPQESQFKVVKESRELIALLDSLGIGNYGDINDNLDYGLIGLIKDGDEFKFYPCEELHPYITLGELNKDSWLGKMDANNFPGIIIYTPFDTYVQTIEAAVVWLKEKRINLYFKSSEGGNAFRVVYGVFNESYHSYIFHYEKTFMGFAFATEEMNPTSTDPCDEEEPDGI